MSNAEPGHSRPKSKGTPVTANQLYDNPLSPVLAPSFGLKLTEVAAVSPGSYDDCNQYDDTMCGFEYSNSGQAAFCAVPQPSSWPALMQVMPVLKLLFCFCPGI